MNSPMDAGDDGAGHAGDGASGGYDRTYANSHRVWYLRTLPDGRTGSFLGHAIAGILIGGLGLLLLLLALYRARNLPKGKSFAELHIPERNPHFLRWFGLIVVIFVPAGMIYDILDKEDGYDTTALTHCTIYAPFFVVGVCSLYESMGRLPADSHRMAMVFSWIVQGMIWLNHHGEIPPDVKLHMILGYINFMDAAIVTYSIKCNDSVVAYVAGWALLVLKGAWLVTIGLYECCLDIQAHEVIIYFTFYCVFLFLAVVLAIVHLGPPPTQNHSLQVQLRGGKFTPLPDQDDDNDEEP